MGQMSKLLLIPGFLDEESSKSQVSPWALSHIFQITDFVVEREKTARKFLKAIEHPTPQDQFDIFEFNKKKHRNSVAELHEFLKGKKTVGLMSEAGMPAIADPGDQVVAIAHQKGWTVQSLPGMNSMLMALNASGLNGQKFEFVGYLPLDDRKRSTAIKNMVNKVKQNSCSQFFMETPYRNLQLCRELLQQVPNSVVLNISVNLTADNESVITKKIVDWKSEDLPDIHKKPAVFILGNWASGLPPQ